MYVKYFAAKFPCFFYIYILLATRNCRRVGAYSKVGHKRAVSPPEKNLQQASKFTRRLLSIIFLNLTSVSVFHGSLTLTKKKGKQHSTDWGFQRKASWITKVAN